LSTFSVKVTNVNAGKGTFTIKTYHIDDKYLESVKLELVKYELKSEGIDP